MSESAPSATQWSASSGTGSDTAASEDDTPSRKVSTNAAKIMGMYPRKGAIAPGSDADITCMDPSESRVVRAEDLHETDYSPWEGKEVTAWPVLTMLRGKVMVENGDFFGDVKDGQYLKRKIPDDIRSGPML